MAAQQQNEPFARTFTLEFPGQTTSSVTVIRFEGEEGLSQPYRFVIDFAAKDPDLDGLINRNAVFTIGGPATGRKSIYRAVVVEIEQTGRVGDFKLYRVVIMPAMINLAKQIQSEIYIDGKPIPEVVQQIFKDAHHIPVMRPKPLSWPDVPLPFICQYQESLLHFVTRLMEREGLYYYFEEENGGESIVIACGPGAHTLMTTPFVYREASLQDEAYDESAIPSLSMRRQILPRQVVLKSYNYQKASLGLLKESAAVKTDGVGEIVLTDEYYRTASEGKRLAAIRAGAILCRERLFTAESAAVGLKAGSLFSLTQHFRTDFNQQYLVVAAKHQGRQPGNYLSGLGIDLAEDPTRKVYWNRLELIPGAVQYRPERVTPKPRIGGTITAVIDGEGSGQYAEINEQGEYKLRFPTLGKERPEGKGSCWIRMASPYGGEDHGMHFPLLKGTEVTVSFRDGDPDQPFISGTIPNSTHQSVVKDINLFANILRTAGGNSLTLGDEKDKAHVTLKTAKGHKLQMDDDGSDPGIDLQTASGEQTISLKDEEAEGEILLAASTPLEAFGGSAPEMPMLQEKESRIRIGQAASGIEMSTNHSVNRVSLVSDSSFSMGNHSKLAVGVMSSFALGMDTATAAGPYNRNLLWGGSEYSALTLTRFCGQEYVNINAKTMIGGEKGVVIGGGFLPVVEAAYSSLKYAFWFGLAATAATTAAGCTAGLLHWSLEKKIAVTGITIAFATANWYIQRKFFNLIKAAPPLTSYGGLMELSLAGAQVSANPGGGRMLVTPLGATLASDASNLNSFNAMKIGVKAQGTIVDINAVTAARLQAKTAIQIKSSLVSIEAAAAAQVKIGASSLVVTPAVFQINSGLLRLG